MKTLLLSVILLASTCLPLAHAAEDVHGGVMAYSMGAVLWQQTAAEAQALQIQGWKLAEMRLQELAVERSKDCRAVVVDLDETVIDNTPYQAWLLSANTAYPEGWSEWTARGAAPAIPGAVECLSYAAELGFDVYYVSNRRDSERVGTMLNLERLGLPQVQDDHVLLRTDESSKKKRRDTIMENCEIVLLVGDNLADFAEYFDKGSLEQRRALVNEHTEEFAQRFILMPNPMYGAWEGAVYDYNYGVSSEERAAMRMNALSPMKDLEDEE